MKYYEFVNVDTDGKRKEFGGRHAEENAKRQLKDLHESLKHRDLFTMSEDGLSLTSKENPEQGFFMVETEASVINTGLSGCKTVDDVAEALSKFGKVTAIDEKIDDGVLEEGPNEYVMMRGYDLRTDRHLHHIKVYYGNETLELGYTDIQTLF